MLAPAAVAVLPYVNIPCAATMRLRLVGRLVLQHVLFVVLCCVWTVV